MSYQVENVSITSQEEMLQFLKERENYTLFLLSNFENFGINLTENPYSGNFKLIRLSGKMLGVFCLTKHGTLLIEADVREPIFDTVLEACLQEPIQLKGVIGNWEFCGRFWEFLKAKGIIQQVNYASRTVLYSMDLSADNFFSQENVRLLTESDYAQWRPLRLDYLAEEGLPNDLTESQFFEQFVDKVGKKIIWGFFLDNALVSIANLNAKALDLGQVGGVYTIPAQRKRGYSKAVMNQILRDAKELHSIRKLIIFTGDNNLPAQKLYLSLGVEQVGYFALLIG